MPHSPPFPTHHHRPFFLFPQIFVEQRQLVAFSAIVQAYWRLKVDGSDIILSGDIAPPDVCMKVGKCGECGIDRPGYSTCAY